MKRGRNQRRRQGVNPNRALDSNGPDVRIRGTAQQIYDKYLALARDASSAGDRVKAENYFQHAEHYFRVLRSIQGPTAQQSDDNADTDVDGEQPSVGDNRQSSSRDQKSAGDEGNDDVDEGANAGRNSARSGSKNGAASADGDDDSAASAKSDGEDGDGARKPRRRRPRRQPRDEAAGDSEDAASEPAAAS